MNSVTITISGPIKTGKSLLARLIKNALVPFVKSVATEADVPECANWSAAMGVDVVIAEEQTRKGENVHSIRQFKATFKGKDGSCGYQSGNVYNLTSRQGQSQIHEDGRQVIVVTLTDTEGNGRVEYDHFHKLIDNWDMIRPTLLD